MPELTTADRNRLDRRDFAYVDKSGGEHLPIHDKEHVRNAVSRWNQTHFESAAAKEAARKKIVAAAKEMDIELSEDDAIMKGAS